MDGFPKFKYHVRGGGHIVVTTPEQEKALGPEWVDNKAPQLSLSPVPVTEKRRGRPAGKEAGTP
jgi:hypothetical protein